MTQEQIKTDLKQLRSLSRKIGKDINESKGLQRQLEVTQSFSNFEKEKADIIKSIDTISKALKENITQANKLRNIYLKAIAELPYIEKKIAIFVYIEGKTYEQAALMVGLEAGTIKSHKIPNIIERIHNKI